MPYKPIQCHLYDYIEIACMRHYQLDIRLLSGKIIRGMALDTRIVNHKEFLLIKVANDTCHIRLDTIGRITVLDNIAEFKTIEINSAKK